MDKYRVWKRPRRKRRLLAMTLVFCLLFTIYPNIWETMSVFAAGTQSEDGIVYVTGYAQLLGKVREQTVPVGTGAEELTLPEGYALMEGVSLPQITVTVQGNSADSVIQELLERIAALSDSEEYLAKEPDTKDEEAYAEWMEGLYQYAGESLDIQEAYEALTGEQQALVSEEALAKLAAWVEIAEQVAGNSMVMTAAASGTCGDNVTWTLDDTGTLTISGSGKMTDYSTSDTATSDIAPWYDYRTSITSIKIQGVTYIGTYAFYALGDSTNGISSVEISGSVTKIGESAFFASKITNIVIPDSVTSIEAKAFRACRKLTSVALPQNLSIIEPYTFETCYELTDVTIPESVTSIGDHAFYGTAITQVMIPGKVTAIDQYAFGVCASLESVSIPNSVKTIGKQAFKGCTSLREVDIPSSVTSIGMEAFKGCSDLATVNFTQSTPPTLAENCFIDSACLTNKGIIIPCSWEDSALTADNGWETYKTNVTKVHNYNYTASDKTITQTCSNGCGHSVKATLTLSSTSLTYTGQPHEPASITYTGDTWAGTEPTITYTGNTNVGTATAEMTVAGQTASVSCEFAITAATLTGVTASGYTGVYDGAAHGITVTAPTGATVKYRTSQGTYTLTSSPTYTNVGNYTVYYQVTKTNYETVEGSATVEITAKPLTAGMITLASGPYTYTGSEIKPAVTVKDGSTTLTSSSYNVSYSNNTSVGTATVTVTGKGNYGGSARKTFQITAADISSATVTLSSATLTYNGSAQTIGVSSVKIGNTPLTEGTDYTISGNVGTNAGSYTITITGIGGYAGSTKTVTFRIEPKPLTADMITLASDSYPYTGSAITPAVTVHDGDRNMDLTEGTDYTVSYANNTSAGTATVTVPGTGNYTGTLSETFTIEYRQLSDDSRLTDYITISPSSTNGWYGSNITLTPINGCGVGETPAGIGSNPVTISQETGADGSTKTIEIYIKDIHGNIYQTEFTYKLDKTQPAVDLTGMTVENGTTNLPNWIIGKKSMIIKIPVFGVADALSGVAEVTYTAQPDNGTAQSGTLKEQDGYYQIALNAQFSGTIQLTAKDNAGNTKQASLTAGSSKVIAEDYTPVVTFALPVTLTPNADGWYNTAVTITVTVADNKDSSNNAVTSGGIAGIRWKDGENGTVQTVTGLPGKFPVCEKEFTIQVTTDGTHTYYVNAVDNAGNESGWQTFTVKVDTGSPVFSGNLTVKNPTKKGADIAFTPSEGGKVYWIVSDTGTAPTAQEVKEQSGQKGGVQDVVGGTANSFTITGFSAGEKHTVYVVLEDGVGNLSEVKTESFLTLQKAPEITLEQLIIDYTNETITVPDSIGDVEVYTDPQHPESSRITPDAAGFLTVTPGTVIYIRYPEKTEGSLTTPASDKAEIQIPGRPDKPAAKQVTVTDTTAKVTNPDSGEEYVLVKKGDNPDWSNANATGQFTGLVPNTEYDIYVRKKATNGSFTSEPAKIPVRTYVRIKEPVIEGEGTGKEGNTASRPDAAGTTVTFAGTYGEEYTPVIKEVDGMEYTPEMTWDEGSRIGVWEYILNVPDHLAEVGITVGFRKRTLTGITTEPGSLTIYADDVANKSIDGLIAYLKNNCSVKAEYDNKTKGTLQADYTTTDSFVPKGGTYRCTVFADGKTKDITLTVAPVTAVVAAPAKLMQIQNADGYTMAEVNAWLPAQVSVTYMGADYTTRTENRAVTWNTAFIGTDFGAATGERTITGTVDLPPWATGQNSVSVAVEFADKIEVEDDDEDDGDDNSSNTTGDNKVIIGTSTGKPSVTPPADIDKPASGTEGSSDKTSDTQERETQEDTTILKPKDGAVIVTVICEDEKNTASVRDTEAVVNAVLTPEQIKLVNDGKTIEIRVDVKDISKTVSEQDKKVIESGFAEYQKEMPGLTLGMYVDISMFVRVGEGDWDAVTHTKEPIEVVIGIPEELKGDDREFSIIRSHDGEYTLLPDMDNDLDAITVSTDMFSAYAIAYEQADKEEVSASGEGSAKCGLCHICPTFLGICLFIWLAVILAILLIIWIVIWSKRMKNQLWE